MKITLNTHSVTKYADFVTLNKMVHKLNNGVQTVGIMSQGIFVEEIHAHSGRTNNATAALSSCNVSRQGRRMNLPLHSFLTKSKYFVWQLKENLDTQILILSKQKFWSESYSSAWYFYIRTTIELQQRREIKELSEFVLLTLTRHKQETSTPQKYRFETHSSVSSWNNS